MADENKVLENGANIPGQRSEVDPAVWPTETVRTLEAVNPEQLAGEVRQHTEEAVNGVREMIAQNERSDAHFQDPNFQQKSGEVAAQALTDAERERQETAKQLDALFEELNQQPKSVVESTVAAPTPEASVVSEQPQVVEAAPAAAPEAVIEPEVRTQQVTRVAPLAPQEIEQVSPQVPGGEQTEALNVNQTVNGNWLSQIHEAVKAGKGPEITHEDVSKLVAEAKRHREEGERRQNAGKTSEELASDLSQGVNYAEKPADTVVDLMQGPEPVRSMPDLSAAASAERLENAVPATSPEIQPGTSPELGAIAAATAQHVENQIARSREAGPETRAERKAERRHIATEYGTTTIYDRMRTMKVLRPFRGLIDRMEAGSAHERANRLSVQVTRAEAQLERKTTELGAYQSQLQTVQENLSRLSSDTNVSMAASPEVRERLERERVRLEGEIERVETDVAGMNREREWLNHEMQAYERRRDAAVDGTVGRMNERIAPNQERIDQLKVDIGKLQDEISSHQSMVGKFKEKMRDLAGKAGRNRGVRALQKEIDIAEKIIAKRTKELDRLDAELIPLEGKVGRWNAEAESWKDMKSNHRSESREKIEIDETRVGEGESRTRPEPYELAGEESGAETGQSEAMNDNARDIHQSTRRIPIAGNAAGNGPVQVKVENPVSEPAKSEEKPLVDFTIDGVAKDMTVEKPKPEAAPVNVVDAGKIVTEQQKTPESSKAVSQEALDAMTSEGGVDDSQKEAIAKKIEKKKERTLKSDAKIKGLYKKTQDRLSDTEFRWQESKLDGDFFKRFNTLIKKKNRSRDEIAEWMKMNRKYNKEIDAFVEKQKNASAPTPKGPQGPAPVAPESSVSTPAQPAESVKVAEVKKEEPTPVTKQKLEPVPPPVPTNPEKNKHRQRRERNQKNKGDITEYLGRRKRF